MTTVEPGRAEITRELTRQHKSFHAGALDAIADTAGGYAPLSDRVATGRRILIRLEDRADRRASALPA
ncbi:hypothetical protein [Nocardia testacea]|uniref:Uncharacterized protein n=1 Tax=Nocardia testacea TaxID=248551 RepID=A0ABW7VWP6_9NOCA